MLGNFQNQKLKRQGFSKTDEGIKKKKRYKYTIQNEKEIIIAITEMKSKTIKTICMLIN